MKALPFLVMFCYRPLLIHKYGGKFVPLTAVLLTEHANKKTS
jgi:hypothetical protein